MNRQIAASKALQILGCDDFHFYDFPDNSMDTVSLLEVAKVVEEDLADFNPQIVLTHFPFDLNIDHRICSQATLIATRPKSNSSVQALVYFEVQSSTEWNFGAQQFTPNLFIDVSDDFESKQRALAEYQIEIEEFPEARSFEGIEARSLMRGVTVGFKKAEAFQVAFMRVC
jgi:LmbE family N-acetylglucosaminyl deacetylase